MSAMTSPELHIDALIPPEMAHKVESVGVSKAQLETGKLLALSVLAGAFIAFGAIFAIVATTGDMPFGAKKVTAGVTFSLGLILVVVAGAELFTGNNLLVMAWASGRISTKALLRNWLLVYLGNFAGGVGIAVLLYLSGEHLLGAGSVGANALGIADSKCQLSFSHAFFRGVLCNVLVCLAVWLCFSARSTADKILAIIFPIAAFVAAGFEHCVANMFFIPYGILVHKNADSEFWNQIGRDPSDFSALTIDQFLIDNLLPVTLGNIVGGAVFVGVVYWFIYLRKLPTLAKK